MAPREVRVPARLPSGAGRPGKGRSQTTGEYRAVRVPRGNKTDAKSDTARRGRGGRSEKKRKRMPQSGNVHAISSSTGNSQTCGGEGRGSDGWKRGMGKAIKAVKGSAHNTVPKTQRLTPAIMPCAQLPPNALPPHYA